jgi:hypothetical protein
MVVTLGLLLPGSTAKAGRQSTRRPFRNRKFIHDSRPVAVAYTNVWHVPVRSWAASFEILIVNHAESPQAVS